MIVCALLQDLNGHISLTGWISVNEKYCKLYIQYTYCSWAKANSFACYNRTVFVSVRLFTTTYLAPGQILVVTSKRDAQLYFERQIKILICRWRLDKGQTVHNSPTVNKCIKLLKKLYANPINRYNIYIIRRVCD